MMFELSLGMFERLGLIVVCAFVMSKTMFFKRYVLTNEAKWVEKLFFGLFWGTLGIFMTLLGTPVSGGIANSRTIPVLLSGIVGGPFVGTVSGIIAGGHRMFFMAGGDLTAFSCGISTMIAGVLGGLFKPWLNQQQLKPLKGFALGILVEVIQMALILLLARPFEEALALVKIIFLPMTFLNALGVGLFLLFLKQIFEEQALASAKMAELSLKIATETLPHFKKGLNPDSAQKATEIIGLLTAFDSVVILSNDRILGHWKNNRVTVTPKESAQCVLKIEDQIVGELRVFKVRPNGFVKGDYELLNGLGNLFSSQLELARVDHQKKLRAEAELNAMRAQIKPHFLFNTINAVMALTRKDPEQARTLLQELSVVLRGGFKDNAPFVALSEEMRMVEAYLNIEKARFPEKLKVEYLVDDFIEMRVPPLILQPLVENAVRHGIGPKSGEGTLRITVKKENENVLFSVEDDGEGIEWLTDRLVTGIGLKNVSERLHSIYGKTLEIDSKKGEGTKVSFVLPFKEAMV